MQHALKIQLDHQLALVKKGVHDSIKDFKWMLNEILSRLMIIAPELMPLPSSAFGYHDASSDGAGGSWVMAAHISPRGSDTQQPLLWQLEWPQDIKDSLVAFNNPQGTITNSDLELAGSLLRLDISAQIMMGKSTQFSTR